MTQPKAGFHPLPASQEKHPRRCSLLVGIAKCFVGTVAAGAAVVVGIWMRYETSHKAGAVLRREVPLAVAQSLSPLAQPHTKAVPAPQQAPQPEAATWPQKVLLTRPVEIQSITETPGGQFVYQTEHFEFTSAVPLSVPVVRHVARVFESTHRLVSVIPLGLVPRPEASQRYFQVQLLQSEAPLGGGRTSAGYYNRMQKCLLVPLPTLGVHLSDRRVVVDEAPPGLSLIVHETTHQLMNRWLPLLPVWLVEGLAEHMASCEVTEGGMATSPLPTLLKQRLVDCGARQASGQVQLSMLPVGELLALDAKTWNAGLSSTAAVENHVSALLLTYYLCHLEPRLAGRSMPRLLQALAEGTPQEQAVRDFVLVGRHPKELEADLQHALAAQGVEVGFLRRGGLVFQP